MSDDRDAATIHKRAFAHYLRTGERLTSGEWLAKQEWKFNPYHDARGRFTSPPGVTVSWGKYGRAYGDPDRQGHRRKRSISASSHSVPRPFESGKPEPAVAAAPPTGVSGGFNSEFVRDATTPGGHAETYFELNKRQAGLDRLRDAAGPKPGAKVQADLREIQKRLDTDRVRLDARQVEVDRQTSELLRAGLAPYDIGAGAINIASGDGKLRDYFSVGGIVPAGAIIRRVGGIVQIGGAQSVVKRLIKAEKIVGVEMHHVPSLDSLKLARLPLRPSEAPVVGQLIDDHRLTGSWGNRTTSIRFRHEVAERLARGDVEGALKMEFDDIAKIKDGAYGHGLEDVARYIHDHLKKFGR